MPLQPPTGLDTRCGTCELALQAPTSLAQRAACGICQLSIAPVLRPQLRSRARASRGAIACLVAAGAMWGSSFAVVHIALDSTGPVTLTFLRCLLGALVLAVVSRYFLPPLPRPTIADAGNEAWTVACGVSIGAAFVLIAFAMQHATSASAGITMAAIPILTTVIAATLGIGTVGIRHVVGLSFGTLAVATTISAAASDQSMIAVLFLCAAALAHASSNIFAALALRTISPSRMATRSIFTAAIVVLPVAAIEIYASPPSGITLTTIFAIFLLGVLPSGMAYLLYFRAVATLGAERSAFVNYIIPSVALLSGVIILGEQLSVIELVSFVLALFALILGMGTQKSVRSQRNRRPQEI